MNKKGKDSNTLSSLYGILKISIGFLFGITFLHVISSKPLKNLDLKFKVGEFSVETSCKFYENELQLTQTR